MRNYWITLALAGVMLAGGWFLGSQAYAEDPPDAAREMFQNLSEEQKESFTEQLRYQLVTQLGSSTGRFLLFQGTNMSPVLLLDTLTGDTWKWFFNSEEGEMGWQYLALPERIHGCTIANPDCEQYLPTFSAEPRAKRTTPTEELAP